MHAGKLAKPVSASAKKDVYMTSQSLDDILQMPGTAEHSFVWQERRVATPSIVGRLLDEVFQFADQAKRSKKVKGVPFFDEIVHTPVYKAPFRREQGAEKAR